jgi:hypothetical protein
MKTASTSPNFRPTSAVPDGIERTSFKFNDHGKIIHCQCGLLMPE